MEPDCFPVGIRIVAVIWGEEKTLGRRGKWVTFPRSVYGGAAGTLGSGTAYGIHRFRVREGDDDLS